MSRLITIAPHTHRTTPLTRCLALRHLGLVVVTLVAVKQALLPLTAVYAGPSSTLVAVVLATWLLRRRASSWGDLGFTWPRSRVRTLALTALTMGGVIFSTQAMALIADGLFQDTGFGSRCDHVEGNLGAYLAILLVVWTHGSFFEELLFRAFTITHISAAMGGGLRGDAVALMISSTFSGYRHAFCQGVHSALLTGASGFAFGLFHLWFGRRNILPLIFAPGSSTRSARPFASLGLRSKP